jgi:hypothetical protein
MGLSIMILPHPCPFIFVRYFALEIGKKNIGTGVGENLEGH